MKNECCFNEYVVHHFLSYYQAHFIDIFIDTEQRSCMFNFEQNTATTREVINHKFNEFHHVAILMAWEGTFCVIGQWDRAIK